MHATSTSMSSLGSGRDVTVPHALVLSGFRKHPSGKYRHCGKTSLEPRLTSSIL